MEITNVRLSPVTNIQILKAYVSVTFDGCFVVHDIKIVQGKKGIIVCMPSKKADIECESCGKKIPLGSMFCPLCGASVKIITGSVDKKKEHRDIAHPINEETRAYISEMVLNYYTSRN
jgi:stage V sporulation protein G